MNTLSTAGRYSPGYPLPVNKEPKRYDVFTDGPVRYLGYSDEFTQATRSVPWITRNIPFWNPIGWFVGITYGLVHAYQRALNKNQDAMLHMKNDPLTARKKSHIALTKTLGFHALASWFGPALIIEGLKKATSATLKKANLPVRQWPAVVGLASIPLMQKLLDPLIERNLDKMARDFYIRVDEQA